MPGFPRITTRHTVHLAAASIIAGFALQTEWAIQHHFESFGIRVFGSALALFVLLQILRVLVGRASRNATVDDHFGELALLLSVLPIFMIIENALLRTLVMVLYTILVVGYAASVLRIRWCMELKRWLGSKAAVLYSSVTGKRLGYSVRDDIEPGVLHVRLRARADNPPSTAEIKARLSELYASLPDETGFQSLRVSIDEVDAGDDLLVQLLEPLSYYARLTGIGRVAVVAEKERMERLSRVLPNERYAVEPAA